MKPAMEWKREHLLDRPVRPMALIVFAAPRGSPQHHPVRRPIACPTESSRIDEGFQKIDRVPVDALPILRDLVGHAAEDMLRQVRYRDPGQHQNAPGVDEKTHLPSPCPATPTDHPDT